MSQLIDFSHLRKEEQNDKQNGNNEEGNPVNKSNNLVAEQILIDTKGNDYKLMIAYGKGNLIHLNFTSLVEEHFVTVTE
jgi:hypothetical protein